MQYQQIMEVLSQCGLGAVVTDADSVILSANCAARRLLHAEEPVEGKRLTELAAPLFQQGPERSYASTAFAEYLTRCPAPEADGLPADCELIVFRDATGDACHDMLISVLNQISESVILCDAESRIWLLNDAAVKMDSIVVKDVLGEPISSVYRAADGSKLLVPEAIRSNRPRLDVRQHYTTRYGKDVDIVSNTFPITQNGQVLGGFSVMEDWSTVDSLHKQIIDLQEKLTNRASAGKAKGKSALAARYTFDDIIHVSPGMNRVVGICRQVARSDSSVMIYGETGTGKELFAQGIHNASQRADGPFLAINCAAIPENLLESLLFGTEKGAYTGAERRPGLFEQASGGTLLLDEINSMQIALQSKLLRVLQDGIIRRVGGMSEIHVDVRVLSNINIPPDQAIAENKLRRDLFYRLGVVNVTVPPLRERSEDIALLAKHFIMQCNKKLLRNVRDIDGDVLKRFQSYSWPGNVRELQHAVEHAMNILPDHASVITQNDIPEHILQEDTPHAPALQVSSKVSLNGTIQKMERSAICQVLRDTAGNISEAARILKMSRQNLQYRIKRYQIDIPALLRQ